MQIAELRINGFRGVENAKLRFSSHNVLIGPNNSGKTTVIEALALLFGRDRLIRDLTEHDFFGSDPGPADRVSIVATITGFSNDDPNVNTAWFREERAVPKWWDPADGSLHAERADQSYRLACQIGLAARFDRDDLAVEVIRYFHDDDDVGDVFDAEVVKRIPPQIIMTQNFVSKTRWEQIAPTRGINCFVNGQGAQIPRRRDDWMSLGARSSAESRIHRFATA